MARVLEFEDYDTDANIMKTGIAHSLWMRLADYISNLQILKLPLLYGILEILICFGVIFTLIQTVIAVVTIIRSKHGTRTSVPAHTMLLYVMAFLTNLAVATLLLCSTINAIFVADEIDYHVRAVGFSRIYVCILIFAHFVKLGFMVMYGKSVASGVYMLMSSESTVMILITLFIIFYIERCNAYVAVGIYFSETLLKSAIIVQFSAIVERWLSHIAYRPVNHIV